MTKTLERFLELAKRHDALLASDAHLFRYSQTLMPPKEGEYISFQRQVQQEVAHEIMASGEMGDLLRKLVRKKLTGSVKKRYDEFARAYEYAANEVPKSPEQSVWDRFYYLVRRYWALESTKNDLEMYRDTTMPDNETRKIASQIEVQEALAHEIISSREIGGLIRNLWGERLKGNRQVIHREVSHEYHVKSHLSKNLVVERDHWLSEGAVEWPKALSAGDFRRVAPILEKIVEVDRRRAESVYPQLHPYEALIKIDRLDFTLTELDYCFRTIDQHVSPLIHAILALPPVEAQFLTRKANRAKAADYRDHLATVIGFDFDKGIIQDTVHPSAIGSRFAVGRLGSLWDILEEVFHEAGHTIYDQNFIKKHYFDPLGTQVSQAVDESQSRFYENHIGLSRAFWRNYFPWLRKKFPGIFGNVSLDEFHRGINKVEPGFIRMQADELTYIKHILLRVDLEKRLSEGSLLVRDAPQAWNDGMQRLFGMTPPNDRLGILQDTHWYTMGMANFAEYLLGSMMAAQLYAAMEKDIPEIGRSIARPQLIKINDWLKDRIHRHGSRYRTHELIERATGKPPGPEDFINYLYKKFGALYQLPIIKNGPVYALQRAA